MANAGVSLGGLGLVSVGGILVWSGINDPDGGPVGVFRDILTGKMPTPGAQKVTEPSGPIVSDDPNRDRAENGRDGGYLPGVPDGGATPVPGGVQVDAQKVVAEARKYLGVPYVWAGESMRGVDCSGLVLVAYKAVGRKLPHLATAQMALGRPVPREQVQPGDLVGWGVRGNYPHIALATGYDQVLAAPTFGQKVQYQKLWEKKVSGFGYPDIVRIL